MAARGEAVTQETDLLDTPQAGPAAVRGGAMRVGGFIVGALVSIVGAALLFRHLGLVNAGHYSAAIALVAILAAFSDLGLTAVGVREMTILEPEERWALARDLLGLRLTVTFIGGIVVTLIAWLAYSPTLGAGVGLACVGLLLLVTQDNFALPLLLGLRLGWVSALDLSRQLLTTLLTVVLVLLGAGLVPFLGMSIPVGIVVLAATAVAVRGTRAFAPTFSVRRWRAFMAKMLPFSLAVAASALYFRESTLLVSALGDEHQLGYFGTSFRILEVLTAVPTLLVGSAMPIFARAARDDHDRLGYALGRVFQVAAVLGAWVAVSVAIAAPLVISIVGGPSFRPAGAVLAIQGIGLGATFVGLVWGNALLSLGLYREVLFVNLAMLTVNGLLVTALVPVDGARGAAVGTALAEVLSAVVQAGIVVRGRPALRPSLRVLPLTALAAAAGLSPLALTGIPVIARLAMSSAVFAAVVLLTRALPSELLDLVPTRLKQLRSVGH